MYKTVYQVSKTPASFRIIAACCATAVVSSLGYLSTVQLEPAKVVVEQEAVFVSLIDEPIAQMPKGEQTQELPGAADVQEEDATIPEPVSEPESEPEPEPVVEPEPIVEPEPVVEPEPIPEPVVIKEPPKPKPKPKPVEKPKPKEKAKPVEKPKAKSVERPKVASMVKGNPDAKPFGTPQGNPNSKPGGNTATAPIRVSSVQYVVKPRPVMPRSSQLRGERGRVMVRVLIGTNGAVKSASLSQASAYSALNNEALKAVRKARFKPYTENGVARESLADIPIDFK